MGKIILKNYDAKQIIRQKIEENLNNGGEIYKFFFGIAYQIVNNFHEAEDATQTALMNFWEKAGYYKYVIDERIPLLEDKRMRNWIWKIGKNSVLDVLRKRKRFKRKRVSHSDYFYGEENEGAEEKIEFLEEKIKLSKTPLSLTIKSEEKEIVVGMISELPEHLRSVVEMFYYNGRKYKEIVEELKIPIGTVKSRLNKARGILRKELDEYSIDTYN